MTPADPTLNAAPDLLIRTSGETRLSDFFLHQACGAHTQLKYVPYESMRAQTMSIFNNHFELKTNTFRAVYELLGFLSLQKAAKNQRLTTNYLRLLFIASTTGPSDSCPRSGPTSRCGTSRAACSS